MEFVVWFALAIGVGFWADSKKRNGFGWGLLSLVISPLLGAIILFFVTLKDQEKLEKEGQLQQQANADQERRRQVELEAEARRTTVGAEEITREVEKLFALRENGLLTEQEFTDRKHSIILTLASKKPRETASDFLSALIPLVKRSAVTADEVAEIKKYVL